MKYTQVNPDAFKQIQLNAGVLAESFDPETSEMRREDILTATSGGVTFKATPTFTDFADDIDNVPKNTKEFMQIDDIEVKLTATSVTMTPNLAKLMAGAADIDGVKVIPRKDLLDSDFGEVWWVGDYSDKNTGDNAGYIAIHMLNTLSTGGFQISTSDKGKGKFDLEFTGHYSMEDTDRVPYEIYVKDGDTAAPAPVANSQLASLSIGNLSLSPSFDPGETVYAATTTNATNTLYATASDENASISLTVNGSDGIVGESITWDEGENTVVVTVENDGRVTYYTVTVTKE